MVTAHEADLLYMRNFLEEITKQKYSQGWLTLKDLKPDTFKSNGKSRLSSRQWSDEFSSWVEQMTKISKRCWDYLYRCKNGTRTSSLLQLSKSLGSWKGCRVWQTHLHCNEETYSRYRSRDCGHLQDTRRSLVPTHRPVLRKECARRNRHRQSTPRIEAIHPDCRIFSLGERDQDVGQRICSTISTRNDAHRHRQSGLNESGPRDPPQSDGNKSTWTKLSLTTWKIRTLPSSKTTHLALHQWILETLYQDKHQVLVVANKVPRQAHTGVGQFHRSEQLRAGITMETRLERLATLTHQEV